MDNFLSSQVINLWKKEYSSRLSINTKFSASHQFHQVVAMCSPGNSFYYILNFSNLSFEYIHPNVEQVTGIKPEEATIEKLLINSPSKELELIEIKEKIIIDFMYSFLRQEDYLFYKIIYAYKCKSKNGSNQTMLLQSTVISQTDDGKIAHVFGVHTDITHLGNVTTDWVSFISLNGKQSYLNIKAEHGSFNAKLANLEKKSITADLTKREKEIITLMSQGLSAKSISEKLFISFNTTRTHRKNILCKTNCSNTAELISKCLAEGII
ncbi:LuxR C-terminal-related transcriptional regulator [uncultured Algoriphagus sp.]|uniref:response regulator transcription factor n=1 Tax=uncultured Algoriphagus sp. TaxID=417365 RepID=UPI0030EF035B|tara:strand:- start:3801 stop:4601 length:801 start_codon:yes stop_codon:yes gene_type:complete